MWEVLCQVWLFAGAVQAVFVVVLMLALFRRHGRSGATYPVSVVICAHRLHPGLPELLHALKEQDYTAEYEVIVVNDGPDAHLGELLDGMAPQFPQLRKIDFDASRKTVPGKKEPLRAGIAAARNPWLLLTDGDCQAGKDWIATMAAYASDNVEIVLGISPYRKAPGILNALTRLDAIVIALLYSGLARAGVPYMAVGRNLLYRKSLAGRSAALPGAQLMSGDDDLFIQAAARGSNTAVCLDPRGFTSSPAERTLTAWIHQKRRHLCTGSSYRLAPKLILTLFNASFVFFWLGFFGIAIWAAPVWLVFAMAAVALLQWLLAGWMATRMRSADIAVAYPPCALLYCLVLISLPFLLIAGPPTTWRSSASTSRT